MNLPVPVSNFDLAETQFSSLENSESLQTAL